MKAFLISTACLIAGHATALTGVEPPLAFASDFGSSIFTMAQRQYGEDSKLKKALGVAYLVQWDGSLKELYRTEGWYSSEVYISRDGQYLVRMGDIGFGSKPRKDDLAVAFYHNGKLLKEYSTADLITDHSKIIATDYGEYKAYYWRYLGPRKMNGEITEVDLFKYRLQLDKNNIFKLYTIDGWTYIFDATKGVIKSRIKSDG
jgi:hypothetical protein